MRTAMSRRLQHPPDSRGQARPGFGLHLELRTLPDPPFLIVASRLADERLWAEALNLGAYDVLAKPFDSTEVTRIVGMAWLRWKDRHAIRGGVRREMALASGI